MMMTMMMTTTTTATTMSVDYPATGLRRKACVLRHPPLDSVKKLEIRADFGDII